MGVDITAYGRLEPLPPHEYSDACVDDHHRIFALNGFDHALTGLPDVELRSVFPHYPEAKAYAPDPTCWRAYSPYPARASNSYSGYNNWRRWLSETALDVDPSQIWANPDSWRDAPFYELINFADNEGWLGPVACKALAADFLVERDRIFAVTGAEFGFHRTFYDRMSELFSHAAGGPLGGVRFH